MVLYLNTISAPGRMIWIEPIQNYAILVADKFYWGPIKIVKMDEAYEAQTFENLLTD